MLSTSSTGKYGAKSVLKQQVKDELEKKTLDDLLDLSEYYNLNYHNKTKQQIIQDIADHIERHGLYSTVLTPNLNNLKQAFLDYVHSRSTGQMVAKSPGSIRIASFNVHFFTDVYEKVNTYEAILRDIKNINADLIVLQEIVIGGLVKINPNITLDLRSLYDDFSAIGYDKVVLCNSVPSWFNSIYGNVLLVHNRIIDKLCATDRMVCKILDESIFTFSKSTSTCMVSGAHKGTCETRCFINVKLPYRGKTMHIFGTHLDVASEITRADQIQQIINFTAQEDPNDVSIILGDFNTNDANQYIGTKFDNFVVGSNFLKDNGDVIDLLKQNGFTDVFARAPPLMTAWNNIRVDFIFIKGDVEGYVPGIYYTDSSDHIPIFVDINEEANILLSAIRPSTLRGRSYGRVLRK